MANKLTVEYSENFQLRPFHNTKVGILIEKEVGSDIDSAAKELFVQAKKLVSEQKDGNGKTG